MGIINLNFKARAFVYPVTNPAEWIKVSGVDGDVDVIAYDDTTEEFAQIETRMPATLDTSGNVIFETVGFAAGADGNEVQLAANHSAKNSGENWDAAYQQDKSGDKVTDGDQDELDYFSWTVALSTLGWAADDIIRFLLSRPAIEGGAKVFGDYYVRHLRLRIPTL